MVYLIMCRSLTYAQRVANALERAGLSAGVLRAPAELSPNGCGYSVRIGPKALSRALTVLNRTGLPYEGIYVRGPEVGYQEVEL
jgi:hypothetical protein